MRMLRIIGALVAVFFAAAAQGDERRALWTTDSLSRLSADVFFEQLRRPIEFDAGGEADLEARFYGAALGLDLLPWLKARAGGGVVEGRTRGYGDYGDPAFSWTLGLDARVWRWKGYDQKPIWWLEWALGAEVTGRETEFDHMKLRWTEYSVKAPLVYSLVFDRGLEGFSELHALELYLGPIWSRLGGREKNQGLSSNFDASEEVGVVGGFTLYITRSVFVGGSLTWVGDLAGRAVLGYSFQ